MAKNDQSDDGDGVCVCVCASHVPVGTHGLLCTLALQDSRVEPKMQPGAANTLAHFALGLMPDVVPEHMLMGANFYAALVAVHGHRPAIKELVDRLQPATTLRQYQTRTHTPSAHPRISLPTNGEATMTELTSGPNRGILSRTRQVNIGNSPMHGHATIATALT